jgi:hypothetical protein
VKKKNFIFIIQNNNINRKHIKIIIKREKIKLLKKLKHEPNIVEITHLCIRHGVQTSPSYDAYQRRNIKKIEKKYFKKNQWEEV